MQEMQVQPLGQQDPLEEEIATQSNILVWRIACTEDFPGGSDGKVSAYNAGNLGSIPGSERSLGEGNGNPLQYSCLDSILMDRGAL